ncbi:MAG: cytochrome c [Acidobacteriia bacterium]|nr:cytochrome c [Terriglobia bacterium]
MTAFPSAKKTEDNSGVKILACVTIVAIVAMIFPPLRGARAQSNVQPDEKAAPSGNRENGKKLYRSDGCFECHGTEGQGAAQVTGPRIGPPQLSFEAFSAQLRHPSSQMPPYTSKVVSDQDLADLYAYLQSRPKAAPAKDIPLLNQ